MSRMKSLALASGVWLALLTATSTSQAADSGRVSIGVLTDISGIYADITGEGSVLAAQMAIDAFGGKVAGKEIKLLVGDHQHKPEIGSTIAREWIANDNVDAIVDLPNSSVLLAVQEIVRERGNALIFASGGQTSRFNGQACSPYGFQWTTNSYATTHGLASLAQQPDAKKWFFVQADYAYGESVAKELGEAVVSKGGEVVGTVKHPLNTADFASYILQAQNSGADVITFISAGSDLTNALKQSSEFGVSQKLTTSSLYVSTVKAVGLELVQGLISSDGYYWDQSPAAAEWSREFMKRHSKGAAPTAVHVGVYSGVLHYLKAVDALKTTNRDQVAEYLKSNAINDEFVTNGTLREDGIMVHDSLVMQAKAPAESSGEWDVFTILQRVPGDQAYLPLSESECPLVRK